MLPAAYFRTQMEIGFGYMLSYSEFRSIVSSSNLIASYNNFNPFAKLKDVVNFCRDIGGVASEVSIITDLINSESHAKVREYYLFFLSEQFNFSC